MAKETFSKKFVEHIFKLLKVKEHDEMIYGDAFVEFTDRKIEIIHPTKVKLIPHKRGKIVYYKVIP